jgi:hypothetical protein
VNKRVGIFAEGLITFDELRSKLEEAERTRERAQAELEALDESWII